MGKGKEKMLTVKEAAAKIGSAQASIRVWLSQGRFPGAYKESTPLGDYWLIPESEVAAFERRTPGPRPGSKRKKRGSKKKPSVN